MNPTLLIIAACLGAFLFGVISAFWGMMVPEIEKKLGKAATVLLANSLGLVIGSIVAGPAVDQLGVKVALSVGIALVATGVFGLGRAAGIASAFAMAMMVGAGGSAIVTAANAVIPDVASTEAARGQWSNIINNFFAVGAFLAPIVLARMIAAGASLKRLGELLGGASVAVLAYYLAIPFPNAKNAGASMTAGAGQVMSEPLFWALAAMLFLYVGCEGSVWYWLNKYLTQELGFAQQAAAATVSLFAIGIIAGRVVCWYLLRQNILRPLSLTLVGAIGITITFIGLVMLREQKMVKPLVAASGVAMAPLFPTVLAATGAAFPEKLVGTAIGLVITGGWLGYVFIPPSIGYSATLRRGMFIAVAAAALLVATNFIALGLVRQ